MLILDIDVQCSGHFLGNRWRKCDHLLAKYKKFKAKLKFKQS